jgi:hypothetical protein
MLMISKVVRATTLPAAALVCAALCSAQQSVRTPAQNSAALRVAPSAATAVRPSATPAMRAKYDTLRQRLSPAASAWVQSEAATVTKNPSASANTVEASAKARFGNQLQGGDIDEIAFVVLMEATDDQDKDLQQIMNQTQAINQQKNKLREVQSQATVAQNELSKQLATEQLRGAKNNAASATVKCTSPACEQLAQKASEANQLAPAAGSSTRYSVTATPTAAQLQDLQKQTSSGLDSLSDMSQQQQLRLQMAMDRQSKFYEAISNIMKSTSDTQSSILQNLK